MLRDLDVLVLRDLDVLVLRDRALPLATSRFWGLTLNPVSFEQMKEKNPGFAFDSHACGACKFRQQQVMRARRA